MFRPAAFFIGLRYTRAKKRNHFISFISMMSMFGIALGIIVLITVLSVMNGFDREITKRVVSMVSPITVGSMSGSVANWQALESIVRTLPNVTATAPFITGQVMLTNDGFVQPALINGILPIEEKKVTQLIDKMVQGDLTDLNKTSFGIVLGEELASRLDVAVGDKITVVTPQVSLSPAGVIPRFKRFTVVGIFRAGSGFGFDSSLSYISLSDAQKLFSMGSNVTGIHVKIPNVFDAPKISRDITSELTPGAHVVNWTDQFGPYFSAVKMEKTMMFFILMLIIAVAAFNLICTLVMVVNEKTADIAILRTFGATPRMVMAIFIVQGAVIGVIGTLLGIIGGIALALNVTQLVNGIEHIFHVQFISSNVYIVDYLPSYLLWSDVIEISGAALILSLLATIYPAWRASRTEPVEALRYE